MDMSTTPAAVEPNSAKLSKLSDEVGRIATTLARMATQPQVASQSRIGQVVTDGVKSSVPIQAVRNAIRARRLRYKYFDKELFADPAWDMLLDLFQADLAQVRTSVSSLCSAAAVPATTALRWIKAMTDAGLFRRYPDHCDARRVFVELSPAAREAMRSYFEIIAEPPSNSD